MEIFTKVYTQTQKVQTKTYLQLQFMFGQIDSLHRNRPGNGVHPFRVGEGTHVLLTLSSSTLWTDPSPVVKDVGSFTTPVHSWCGRTLTYLIAGLFGTDPRTSFLCCQGPPLNPTPSETPHATHPVPDPRRHPSPGRDGSSSDESRRTSQFRRRPPSPKHGTPRGLS